MISLCQIDAAVRQVRYYNPDLELELLFIKEAELSVEDIGKIAHIKTALVARIADIVRQASNQSQALDAAVSTVEILISSCNSHGQRPGRGHKHALQGIRLLASVPTRFDAAVDLFFDLVERSLAQGDGETDPLEVVSAQSKVFATRMLQNYDQTLVKLVSRQWSEANGVIHWNVQTPIDRITTLRKIYDPLDNRSMKSSVRQFGKRQCSSILFPESLKVLRQIRKASTELIWAIWARNLQASLRSLSKKKKPFDPTVSSTSTSSTFSDLDPISPISIESRRKYIARDAKAMESREQFDMVYALSGTGPHDRGNVKEWS